MLRSETMGCEPRRPSACGHPEESSALKAVKLFSFGAENCLKRDFTATHLGHVTGMKTYSVEGQ